MLTHTPPTSQVKDVAKKALDAVKLREAEVETRNKRYVTFLFPCGQFERRRVLLGCPTGSGDGTPTGAPDPPHDELETRVRRGVFASIGSDE